MGAFAEPLAKWGAFVLLALIFGFTLYRMARSGAVAADDLQESQDALKAQQKATQAAAKESENVKDL